MDRLTGKMYVHVETEDYGVSDDGEPIVVPTNVRVLNEEQEPVLEAVFGVMSLDRATAEM